MIYPVEATRLREWLDKYDWVQRSFVGGMISRIEAVDALRNLRFRDDALRIELLEWSKLRDAHLAAVGARAKDRR